MLERHLVMFVISRKRINGDGPNEDNSTRQCYGWSLPYGISVNGFEDFNEKREVINNLLKKRLKMLARDLVVYSKLIRGQFLQDLSNDLEDTFAARYR